LQQVFHVTKDYLMELRNEEYWPAYTGQILCPSSDMKRTSEGRPKSSQIRTDMHIREQHDRTKNVLIVKHQDTQKKHLSQHYWIVHFSSLIMFHFAQTI